MAMKILCNTPQMEGKDFFGKIFNLLSPDFKLVVIYALYPSPVGRWLLVWQNFLYPIRETAHQNSILLHLSFPIKTKAS